MAGETTTARRGLRPAEITQGTLVWTALLIGAAFSLLPYLWMVSSSLKTNDDMYSATIQFLPSQIRWDNYVRAWSTAPVGRSLLNSVIVASGCTVGNLAFSVLTAYAFARLRFRGREILFLAILGTMMIPHQATLIPTFILMRWFGLVDSYPGLILPGMITAFGIFLMRQFFLGIPTELEDAARVDGCGRIRCLIKIMLPLCGPALSALAIFTFTQTWNDFFWPLIIVRSSHMGTIQILISALKAQDLVDWGALMATVTIAATPTMILFVSLQRYFVRGIVMTGLKG
ncbi:MAG: carbohydrate ABC transporter permease [Dehalococcoidales bacterium]|nr:carbohydrate ABC transporter permease [Dehalococcoidales bacterium]